MNTDPVAIPVVEVLDDEFFDFRLVRFKFWRGRHGEDISDV